MNLPPIHDAPLAPAAIDALFADLELVADALEITARSANARRADSTRLTLADARAALDSGTVAALQLRYRFDGADWCDTLIRTATGARLIRIDVSRALAYAQRDAQEEMP